MPIDIFAMLLIKNLGSLLQLSRMSDVFDILRVPVWGSLIVKLSGDGARVTRPSANQIAHLRAHRRRTQAYVHV